MNRGLMSIRGYAKTLNVSETAIRKAIKSGKIKQGFVSDSKQIIPDVADKEYGITKKGGFYENPVVEEKKIGATKDMSYADVRKAKEIAQTKLLMLELQREEGKLVSKEVVYKVLFSFMRELCKAHEQLPDRLVDGILGADSRNAALKLSQEMIFDIQNRLCDVDHLNFDER